MPTLTRHHPVAIPVDTRDHLTRLPVELLEKIAASLSGYDLKRFRLACKQTAAVSWRSLQHCFQQSLEWHRHPSLQYDDAAFVNAIVKDVQTMEKCAGGVWELNIDKLYHPHLVLPSTLASVNLPALESLRLSGVVVDPTALMALFKTHKDTLCDVKLSSIDLESNLEPGGAESYHQWTEILCYIRDAMDVEYLEVHDLGWAKDGTASIRALKFRQAKFHTRVLEQDPGTLQQIVWFRVSSGGVTSRNAVPLAIDMFVREAIRVHPTDVKLKAQFRTHPIE